MHSLSNFDPIRVRWYRWNYAWEQLKALYVQQNKERSERINQFCEFLVSLTQAALGGKSDNPDEIGLADDTGKDEMSDEQLEMWRGILSPSEFETQFGEYV